MKAHLIHPLLLLLFASLAFTTLHAQDDDAEYPAIAADRLEQIKAQKSAFITQRLNLTTEQACTFWPIYDRYEAEKQTLRKEMRGGRYGSRALKKETLTEAEAEKALNQRLAAKFKELELRTRYTEEFKKSIGAVKTLQLEGAERDFNRELLKRIRAQGVSRGRR